MKNLEKEIKLVESNPAIKIEYIPMRVMIMATQKMISQETYNYFQRIYRNKRDAGS